MQNKEFNISHIQIEKSYLRIIWDNFFNFLNLFLIGVSLILLFVVGFETVLNLSFLVVGLINTLVGTI